MGAWIETYNLSDGYQDQGVAPYVGAWIETESYETFDESTESHPTWVRGLKQDAEKASQHRYSVAPYVGAWIETEIWRSISKAFLSRTLRGCVD